MQLDPTSDEAFRPFLPGQQSEDDRMLIPEFFVGKKLMGFLSEKAGRPVYEDREFVRIMIKGQDKQIHVEEVKESHKQRFPIAYHAFLQKKPVPVVGTPIEMMPGVGPSMAHHLKGLNLRAIEDLASVTDENTLQRIGMGARDLVRQAKAWIEKSTGQAIALAEEKSRLERENEELRKQLAEKPAKPKRKAKRARRAAPEPQPSA